MLKDDSRKLVFLNQKASEFYGRPREELIGQDVSFFTEPDQAARQRERDIEVLETGEKRLTKKHWWILQESGAMCWCASHASRLRRGILF